MPLILTDSSTSRPPMTPEQATEWASYRIFCDTLRAMEYLTLAAKMPTLNQGERHEN